MFMANNNWYIFLRLHAILCERLAKIYERAVILASEEEKARDSRKESTALALRLKPKPHIEIEDYYPAFLDMVKNLLDGNMDGNSYEDTLREMFGIHAFTAFTLDKVVSYAVRQLQHCVTERTAIACTELFLKEQKRGAAGGPCATAYRRVHQEMAYQKEGEKAVQDENCFKIYIYKRDCKMTIELLDTEPEDSKKVEETKKWSNYKESYIDYASREGKLPCPVYLCRNVRLMTARRNANNAIDKKSMISSEEIKEALNKRLQQANREAAANSDDKMELMEELERKLNERSLPERNQTDHPGYHVEDNTECKFNSVQESPILFNANKDSFLYKISALCKARKVRFDTLFIEFFW